MKVSFVRPDLRHLDEVAGEAIALGVFEDERPLRGPAGLVDWRLNGSVSRWIAAHRFSGVAGETLLYPDRGRLSFGRVLLRGLGPRSSWNEDAWHESVVGTLRTLRDMGVRRFSAAPPGRALLSINVRLAIEQWLGALRDVYLDEPARPIRPEVHLIEDTDTWRAVGDTVQNFLRRLARNRGWE